MFARKGAVVPALIGAVAATVLLLAGCGGGSPAPASTPTPLPPVALETSVTPNGGGTVQVVPSPSKDSRYPAGTNLLLTASAAPGYQFVGWAGGAGGSANPLSLSIQADTAVVASFAPVSSSAPATTPTVASNLRAATPTQTASPTVALPAATPTSAAAARTPTAGVAGQSTPTPVATSGRGPTPAVTPPAGGNTNTEKDPLSFKIVELAGGKIAVFDNWRIVPVGEDNMWIVVDTAPNGRDDFAIRVILGMPGTQAAQRLFVDGPPFLRQFLPGFTPVGQPVMTKYGGDEAMVEEYQGTVQGKAYHARIVYIKKTDVVVGLMAIGSDQGFKEFGRSVDILAQSITVNQSPLPPTLIGTWRSTGGFSSDNGALNTGKQTFSSTSETNITIYPNGTFTETSMSFSTLSNRSGSVGANTDGSDRGRIVVHGTTLSFNYDNGKVWNADYKFDSGALVLNGTFYSRVG